MTVSREGVTVGATALLDWISQGEKGRKSPACRGPAHVKARRPSQHGDVWEHLELCPDGE